MGADSEMKFIQELLEMRLTESVTFGVAEFIEDDPDFPKGLFTGEKWWRKEVQKCPFCEDGKEHYRGYKHPETGEDIPAQVVDCDYCDGKGEREEHVSDSPELNVSNDNALAIIEYLGLKNDEDGTVGSIDPKDFPAIRRKLIKLKNGDQDALTSPYSDEQDKVTRRYKDENGMDRIGTFGPRMISGGRSVDQVIRHADKLLAMIDFAQKNNAHVTWA